jgi:hypothetical protein
MKEWPKEDPYDVDDIRKAFFSQEKGRKEKIQEQMQKDFDKLKAEGKIPESLHGMLMSEEVKTGINFLVYCAIKETKDAMAEMAKKNHRQLERSELFLNYSNMIMQIIHALIEESLTFEYKLVSDLEDMHDNLYKYRDLLGRSKK